MNRKKGFTLIEIIVTIALLGIIGTVIAINVVGLSKKQDTNETNRLESAIEAAAEAYEHVEDIGTGCLKIKTLIETGYLQENDVAEYKDKFVLIKENSDNTKSYEIIDSCSQEATQNEYKIVYKKNLDESVSNMPSDATQYKLNDEIILSDKVPTTYGYNFKYWSTSKDGLAVKTPLKMGNHRITLYAIWQKKTFEINYNTNGGSPNPSKQIGEYKNNVTINAENPSKIGYSFKYWKDSNANKTYVKNDVVTLNKNINLSAEYSANIYEITLDHQNGQNSINKIYEKYNSGFYSSPNADNNIASPNIANTTKITTIAIPQKKGYKFLGYYTQPNGAGNKYIDENGKIIINNTTVTNNIKLYAQYSANIYEITLDHQNGQNSINKIYEKYDNGFYSDSNTATKITTIAIPQKKGYKFLGYYTQPNGAGNKYIDENGKIIINNNAVNNNIKLYAQYSANIYEITLDHQNGQNSINKIYEKYNSGFYSSPNADNNIASPNIANTTKITTIAIPQKEGYNFKGYYTQSNGAGNKYIDENGKIIINNTTVTNNIKLYAYYTKKEYDITINVTNGTKNNPILTKIKYAESGEQKITPKDGYGLNASKGGKVSCNGSATYSYDNNNNILKLSNVKGNITCTINLVKTNYKVTLKVKNGAIADLYNQVLYENPVIKSIKYSSNELKESEPYIVYDLKEDNNFTVKKFIDEQNLIENKTYDVSSIPGKCSSISSKGLTVCSDGKIPSEASLRKCYITRKGDDLIGKSSDSCSSGYWFSSNGLTAYQIHINSERKVTSVQKYTVADNKSTGSGIYHDSEENSYFYRGEIKNNYVSFAGKTWRILGLNADKSIRLIGEFNTGSKLQWYEKDADEKNFGQGYVKNLKAMAYTHNTSMYKKENPGNVIFEGNSFYNQNSEPNSLPKSNLENWYLNNLKEYDSYIAYSLFNNYTSYEMGTEIHQYYMACRYLIDTHCNVPRTNHYLPCYSNYDEFSTNTGGVYKSKIGLITAEEVAKSGFSNKELSKSYGTDPLDNHFLKQNYTWWTMSPSHAYEENTSFCNWYHENGHYCYRIQMAIVNNSGLAEDYIDSSNYVRPVISLKEGTKATGDGSKDNPYKIISPSEVKDSFEASDNEKYTYAYPIYPDYKNEFTKVTCTNNQTQNASYDKATKKFSIKPTSDTVCTIEFERPYYYDISIIYPNNFFKDPKISFNGDYTITKSDNGHELTLKLKFFNPDDFNLNITINNYRIATLSGDETNSLTNLTSTCSGYQKNNNVITFKKFDISQNEQSCKIVVNSSSS